MAKLIPTALARRRAPADQPGNPHPARRRHGRAARQVLHTLVLLVVAYAIARHFGLLNGLCFGEFCASSLG